MTKEEPSKFDKEAHQKQVDETAYFLTKERIIDAQLGDPMAKETLEKVSPAVLADRDSQSAHIIEASPYRDLLKNKIKERREEKEAQLKEKK